MTFCQLSGNMFILSLKIDLGLDAIKALLHLNLCVRRFERIGNAWYLGVMFRLGGVKHARDPTQVSK